MEAKKRPERQKNKLIKKKVEDVTQVSFINESDISVPDGIFHIQRFTSLQRHTFIKKKEKTLFIPVFYLTHFFFLPLIKETLHIHTNQKNLIFTFTT